MPLPQENGGKNCGIVTRIGVEPMRRGFVAIPRACSRHAPGLKGTRMVLIFLVFLAGLLAVCFLGFLGFAYAISGWGTCFNRKLPKKLSPAASNRSIFLCA